MSETPEKDPKGDMMPFVPEGYEDLDYRNYKFDRCLTRMDSRGPFDKEDVVAALLSARGALGIAAGYLGRSRSSLVRWLKAHPTINAVVADYKATQLDAVEVNTFDAAIIDNEGADRRFLLTTLGKERGFSSRSEVTGKDGEPLMIADLSKMSNDQLRELKAIAERNNNDGENRPTGDSGSASIRDGEPEDDRPDSSDEEAV